MGKLSNPEFMTLATANSDREWEAACMAVKMAHGGKFPADWHEQLFDKGGLYHAFMKRMSSKDVLWDSPAFVITTYYA